MPQSAVPKVLSSSSEDNANRLTPEEKLLQAIFGKSTTGFDLDSVQMFDILEQAQAQTLRGQITPIKPAELASWASRFSLAEIEELIVPKRTLARRRARREPLNLEETDKALRLARISAEADRVFGSPSKASRWLRKPNAALGGQTPLALLKTETGARAVDELLGQIDHGMFV
jgi:putative toxin-antitoxin system antitoxin component (TIGR02293 family)